MELRTEKGRVVRLSGPLTRPGGEGQVFEIENSKDTVAKLYHQPAEPQKATKLRCQVGASKPELRSVAAWPTELLLDARNPAIVRGIVMPRMAGKEIHRLYVPSDRAVEFPSVRWDFLIHVAMNCAAAFETLHQVGVVMADVNEGNILVREGDGKVGLIDCDSYQIANGSGYYLCDVGIPMWTPPELQGKNFRGLQRTPNHDRFGLAVMIFRLLFMGRHPFAGIPTSRDQYEIAEAIQKCLFAFSPSVWASGIKSPPHTIGLKDIPGRLASMFERAFLQSSVATRPSGQEWALELRALLTAVKKGCIDPGHRFWNGRTSCPWCEIANDGGPNFFISVAINIGSADLSAECLAFWTRIERVLQGPLMQAKVAVPPIGGARARPMPLAKPSSPTLVPPVAPMKPSPLPRPKVTPPQFPPRPKIQRCARLPRVPLGPNENVVRLCGFGIFFSGAFAVISTLLEIDAAKYGALWAFATCLVVLVFKIGGARQELASRREADRKARQAEERRVEKEQQERMMRFEAEVERLTKEHAVAVARADAGYHLEWVERNQEYQSQYNKFLADQATYDAANRKYEINVGIWNKECTTRRIKEEQARRQLNTALDQLEKCLDVYRAKVNAEFPALEAARQRFDKGRADELAEMKLLHQKRQELQLKQFLAAQLIQSATIENIGNRRKADLVASGIDSALRIQPGINIPGFGDTLMRYLFAWRRQCESRFRYNPNAPLPAAEVNRVKIKHAQTRQSALAELRGGVAKLEKLEAATRGLETRSKVELLNLARAHAQTIADLSGC